MVRPKLILKPIPNGRDRDLAFTKRKKALMKKMTEFSNVCGVKACMIMYDGNYGDAPPLTWPQDDPIEVHSIIKRYESIKNEKLPKNFDLNNFFEIRKNMVDNDISKVQKETLKIKYPTWHPSFNNLGVEELRNFIARLDIKLEACNQRNEMSKHNHQNEANFNFMQSMVQSDSVAPNPSQLNFMQEISQNQFSLAPMRPLNDGNQVASYLLNLDIGSSSQSQMLNFDPNLMQLIAKNQGVMDITNQVDVPLACANQINALGNFTNQHDVPVDLTNHQLGECLDYFSQLDEIEDLTSQLNEIVNSGSQPGESIIWTNQHGVPVIGGSTTAMNGATNYGTKFHGDEHNQESSHCNYNEVVQSMQPYNYDAALQNIASQSENVQQIVTWPSLLPPKDEFQTDHYNKTLQNQYSNHFI